MLPFPKGALLNDPTIIFPVSIILAVPPTTSATHKSFSNVTSVQAGCVPEEVPVR